MGDQNVVGSSSDSEYLSKLSDLFPKGDSQKSAADLKEEFKDALDSGVSIVSVKGESAIEVATASIQIMEDNPNLAVTKDIENDEVYFQKF